MVIAVHLNSFFNSVTSAYFTLRHLNLINFPKKRKINKTLRGAIFKLEFSFKK